MALMYHRVRLEAGASSATVNPSLFPPAPISSHQPDNLPQSGDDGAKAPGSNRPDKEVPKGDVKITGKNTHFAPRSVVKPLGWTSKDEKPDVGPGELKSNEQFRNLLLKK